MQRHFFVPKLNTGGLFISSIMAFRAAIMQIARSPGGRAVISDGNRPVWVNIQARIAVLPPASISFLLLR